MESSTRGVTGKNLIEILIRAVSILNLLVFVFSTDTFMNESVYSLASRLLLIANLLILTGTLMQRFIERDAFWSLVLLAAMGLSAYVSYSVHPIGGMSDFLIKLCCYLAVPIYILAIPQLEQPAKMLNWFKALGLIYGAFFVICGIFFPSYRKGTDALMLGYSNSNRTGAYMLLVFVMLVLLFYREEKKVMRWGVLIMQMVLMYLMILTQCRTAYLLSLASFIYSILPRVPRVGKKFSCFCILFPAVFLILYVAAYNAGWMSDATIMGRTIYSGRQYTFVKETHDISLLGNYAISGFGGLNYVQAVMNTVGVAGLVLCWVYYTRFFKGSFLDDSDLGCDRSISRFCFSVLMVHGCTETSFFTGGTVYAGMIGCILMVICLRKYQEEELLLEEENNE